jgi:hypothetical protein
VLPGQDIALVFAVAVPLCLVQLPDCQLHLYRASVGRQTSCSMDAARHTWQCWGAVECYLCEARTCTFQLILVGVACCRRACFA